MRRLGRRVQLSPFAEGIHAPYDSSAVKSLMAEDMNPELISSVVSHFTIEEP
jgi:hypothetical protein